MDPRLERQLYAVEAEGPPGTWCLLGARMTLRDYFAAQALTVLATKNYTHIADIAETAYKIADYMLAAREGG